MKQCQEKSISHSTDCAREVLNVVPLMMRNIRTEVRRHYKKDLSIPQFRSLAFITQHPNTSLSEVSEHLGIRLPSTSKVIDGLVKRGLVTREDSAMDRRRVNLLVTKNGKTVFDAARQVAQKHLAGILEVLSESELDTVIRAMQALHPVFSGNSSNNH